MAWQKVDRPELVKPWFLRDSPGFALAPELLPTENEAIFDKLAMSAFEGTPLGSLARLRRPVGRVVGIALEIGIEPRCATQRTWAFCRSWWRTRVEQDIRTLPSARWPASASPRTRSHRREALRELWALPGAGTDARWAGADAPTRRDLTLSGWVRDAGVLVAAPAGAGLAGGTWIASDASARALPAACAIPTPAWRQSLAESERESPTRVHRPGRTVNRPGNFEAKTS